MRFRTNQTDWMVQIWDPGTGGFSDYWRVSTWSKTRKAGLEAAKKFLILNRGEDKIPRFKVIKIKDNDIRDLFILVKD